MFTRPIVNWFSGMKNSIVARFRPAANPVVNVVPEVQALVQAPAAVPAPDIANAVIESPEGIVKIRAALVELKGQYFQQLETMLAPNVYRDYILHAPRDALGRYVVDGRHQQNAILYYQHTLNMIKDLLRVLGRANELSVFVRSDRWGDRLWNRIVGVVQERSELNTIVNMLRRDYKALMQDITALQLDTMVNKLPAFQQVTKLLFPLYTPSGQITSLDQSIRKQIINNPFSKSYDQHANAWRSLVGLPPHQDGENVLQVLRGISMPTDALQALTQILEGLSGHEVSEQAKRDIRKSIITAKNLAKKIDQFSRSNKNVRKMVSFAYDVIPLANELMKTLPQSSVSGIKTLRDQLLITTGQVNTMVRDVLLCADYIETKMCLKENYITSLFGDNGCSLHSVAASPLGENKAWLKPLLANTNDAYLFHADKFYYVTKDPHGRIAVEELRMNRLLYPPIICDNDSLQQKVDTLKLTLGVAEALPEGQQHRLVHAALSPQQLELVRELTAHSRRDYSLRRMGREFNELVEEYGYKFADNEGYPYSSAIVAQRKKMLETTNDLCEQQLFRERLVAGENLLREQSLQAEKVQERKTNECVLYKKKRINALISKRIDELSREMDGWFSFGNIRKSKKIGLLNGLKVFLGQDESVCSLLTVNSSPLEDRGQFNRLLNQNVNEAYVFYANQLFYIARENGNFTVSELALRAPYTVNMLKPRLFEGGNLSVRNRRRLDQSHQQFITLMTGHERRQQHIIPSLYDTQSLRLRLQDYGIRDPHLLFTGRTGKMLKEIRYLTTTRQDELQLIETREMELRKQQSAGFWFFNATRQRRLAIRLDALAVLKTSLNKSGYRVTDALEEMQANHHANYSAIIGSDDLLLKELKKIESYLPEAQIGKMLIESDNQPEAAVAAAVAPPVLVAPAPVPAPVPVPVAPVVDANFYQNIKAALASLEQQLRQKLATMMVGNLHREFIVYGAQNRSGRYIIDPAQPKDAVIYYQHTLNTLMDLQALLGSASDMHNFILSESLGDSIFSKAKSVAVQSLHLYNAVESLRTSQDKLMTDVQALHLDGFVNQLPAFKEIRQWLMPLYNANGQLTSLEETVKEEFARNPFTRTYTNHADAWHGLLHLPRDVERAQLGNVLMNLADSQDTFNGLIHILQDLSGREVSPDIKSDIGKSLQAIKSLKSEYERFTEPKKNIPAKPSLARRVLPLAIYRKLPLEVVDMVGFAYRVLPHVSVLMKTLPHSCISVNKALRDKVISTAQQLNVVLRDVFLCVDHVEAKMCMKENQLLPLFEAKGYSIAKFGKEFNSWVEGLNHEFSEAERYPYAHAILAQRQQLLNAGGTQVEVQVRRHRVKHAESVLQAYTASTQRKKDEEQAVCVLNKKNQINRFVNDRIADLTREMGSWFAMGKSTKAQKINLLTEFQHTINQAAGADALALDIRRYNSVNAHGLFSGRTGNMMNNVNSIAVTKQDRVEAINCVDAELTKQVNAGFWFFSATRRGMCEARHGALVVLRDLLNRPGYRLDDALELMRVNFDHDYKVLTSLEKSLLKKIRNIEMYLPPEQIGMKAVAWIEEAVAPVVDSTVAPVPG